MFERNTQIRKNFKPMTKVYWYIIILCIIIRIIPVSTRFISLDDAINDLAVGAMASTIVAWLIDIANCRIKNEELNEKEMYVFSEYLHNVSELCYCVSKMGTNLWFTKESHSLKEWLDIIANLNYYEINIAKQSRIQNYQYIAKFVEKIKQSIQILKQQHFLLMEIKVIDTYDFLQHADLQLRLCEKICDNLDDNNFSEDVIGEVNEQIDSLVGSCRLFFLGSIPERFNWMNGKG